MEDVRSNDRIRRLIVDTDSDDDIDFNVVADPDFVISDHEAQVIPARLHLEISRIHVIKTPKKFGIKVMCLIDSKTSFRVNT